MSYITLSDITETLQVTHIRSCQKQYAMASFPLTLPAADSIVSIYYIGPQIDMPSLFSFSFIGVRGCVQTT